MVSHVSQVEFHTACSYGHDGLVVECLRNHPVSVQATTEGRTPLLEACWKGHASTAAILISAGSDVNAKDEEDFSCMHTAALHGFTEILNLLLRHGANLEALDDALSTPFALAAFNFHRSAMRLLADRGANLSPVARDKVTPLNFACVMGNDAKARLLLELGENHPRPQARSGGRAGGRPRNGVLTKEGETCLPQVIGYMWQSIPAPDLLRESAQGRAPGCAWGRHLTIAEMLIAAGASLDQMHNNMMPLHFAAGIGSRRLMTSLLRAGAETFTAGRPPTGVVCLPLSWAAACSRPLMVRLLLQGGALETDGDERCRPPLSTVGSYVPSLPPAPKEEVEERALAVTHALLRGPAFRAKSFLWPASASGQTAAKVERRPLAVRRCGGRGGPVALRGMWRCVFFPAVCRAQWARWCAGYTSSFVFFFVCLVRDHLNGSGAS